MSFLTSMASALYLGIKLGACAASATITWVVLVSVVGGAYLLVVMAIGRFLRLAGD